MEGTGLGDWLDAAECANGTSKWLLSRKRKMYGELCEECQSEVRRPHYGYPGGPRRWCGRCSGTHAGAQLLEPMCQDCGLNLAGWGGDQAASNTSPTVNPAGWGSGRCYRSARRPGHRSRSITPSRSGLLLAGARCLLAACEDCGVKHASYGVPGGAKMYRWCRECSKEYPAAQPMRTRCEQCGVKQAQQYGVPGEAKKRRWCRKCSKGHAGVHCISSYQRCEDCGVKAALYGVPGEAKKKRWCKQCGKGHAGSQLMQQQCEDCGVKQAQYMYGVLGGAKKKRWCKQCGKGHAGAVYRRTLQNSLPLGGEEQPSSQSDDCEESPGPDKRSGGAGGEEQPSSSESDDDECDGDGDPGLDESSSGIEGLKRAIKAKGNELRMARAQGRDVRGLMAELIAMQEKLHLL